MHKPIKILPAYLANQIAAGEVIERPASIVKELIENSLDAGANQLHIHIYNGGLDSIQIRDNGSGILSEELSLALSRHATNKVYHPEDIESIKTLGFRGEALASISAVAHVKLSSRVQDAKHGWEIVSEPGDKMLSATKPTAHPIGTTLTISELFHKTPARRRFLRSPSTEFARIHTLIKCFSLNYFNVGFNLYHNQRRIFELMPHDDIANRAQRLALVCGTTFAETALFLEKELQNGLGLSGWVSSPNFSRGQADLQYFYVNGRLIKDKIFSHAIKQAYQDVLYQGRQPAVVLFLEIDPYEVDVNVHPTKTEVRFRQAQLIYDFIRQCIKSRLAQQQWHHPSHEITLNAPNVAHPSPLPLDAKNTIKDTSTTQSEGWTWQPKSNTSSEESMATPPLLSDQVLEAMHNTTPYTPPKDAQPTVTTTPTTQTVLHDSHATPPLGYALAQLHGTYILAENNTGLIIVDAHAAHERILYERFKTELAEHNLPIQHLLVPVKLALTTQEIETAQTHYALFKQLGFDYAIQDETILTVTTIPQLLQNSAIANLIQDALSELQLHGTSHSIETKMNQLLGTLACRSAIHTNFSLNLDEMNQVLRLIETTARSGQCNHGRPTWRQMTMKELDSWFLRGR